MRRLLIACLLLLPTAALADKESDAIKEAAEACWNSPVQIEGVKVTADFDVTVAVRGELKDIEVTKYSPENETGQLAVRSLSKAIERCGVSFDTSVGVHKVSFRWDGGATPIDPFKKK